MQNEKVENAELKLVATLTSQTDRRDFVKEVENLMGGENILDCIQCGICSGSCPTRFAMDYSPMQIIKMMHLGMRDEVLSSSTIWICSTCHTCATRCPRGINFTLLMMSLRNVAIQEKFIDEGELAPKFHKSFFEVINKYGRLHEPALFIRMLKKSDIKGLFHNASLGWRLFRKGRLHFQPQRIEHETDLINMLEKLQETES